MLMYRLMIVLCLVGLLAGCSFENKTGGTAIDQSEEATPTPPVKEEIPETAQETSTPDVALISDPPMPTYLDESLYQGVELGIVKTLNNMMKALYEKDIELYYSIIAEDGNREKVGPGFKMYFISFDTLDFTVKPEPTPPEGAVSVWIEYTERVNGYKRIEKDKQLFTFVLEDDTWKLLYVADWWRF